MDSNYFFRKESIFINLFCICGDTVKYTNHFQANFFRLTMFFDELTARAKGEQEILIVRIPKIKAAKKSPHGFKIECYLPHQQASNYTDQRGGRILLENVARSPINDLLALPLEEPVYLYGEGVRGIAGGITYIYKDQFLLQEKFYPKSGDRYFSCFSGLSSSLRDIQQPRRVVAREGIEEFIIGDFSKGKMYLPAIHQTSFFKEACTQEEIASWTKEAFDKMQEKSTQRINNFATPSAFFTEVAMQGERDALVMRDDQGNLLDSFSCIIDLNPKANGFDILKVLELKEVPNEAHFFEAEFGNTVVAIPFAQFKEMWQNWGSPINLKSYLSSGEVRDMEYRGYCDSLVQSVAMSLGIIQGAIRLDYKRYGEKST